MLHTHRPWTERGDLHPYKGTRRATGEVPSPFQGQITNAAWHNGVNLPDQRHPSWFHPLSFPIPGAPDSPQNNMFISQRSTEQWGGNPISLCLPKDRIIKFWLNNAIAPGWFPTSLQFYCQLAVCCGIDWICQGFLEMGGQDLLDKYRSIFTCLSTLTEEMLIACACILKWSCRGTAPPVHPGISNCSASQTCQGPRIRATQSSRGQ